jgi:hypothetical protein
MRLRPASLAASAKLSNSRVTPGRVMLLVENSMSPKKTRLLRQTRDLHLVISEAWEFFADDYVAGKQFHRSAGRNVVLSGVLGGARGTGREENLKQSLRALLFWSDQ